MEGSKKVPIFASPKRRNPLGFWYLARAYAIRPFIKIKVWWDAKNDTATNKNNFKRGMDWYEMLQEMYGEKFCQLEDRVDQKVRESIGRVEPRMFVPETNGLVIANCLCDVLGMKLNEQTCQRFFCNRVLLDEAMATFVNFECLVKSGILIDRFAA